MCRNKLKVKDRSLRQLQMYAPNAVSEHQVFVNDVDDALQRVGVGSTKSTIFLRDFNAHIGIDRATRKGVIGKHRDLAFNENGRYLLQLCSFPTTELFTSTHGTDPV